VLPHDYCGLVVVAVVVAFVVDFVDLGAVGRAGFGVTGFSGGFSSVNAA
jgi:hypothetical protein